MRIEHASGSILTSDPGVITPLNALQSAQKVCQLTRHAPRPTELSLAVQTPTNTIPSTTDAIFPPMEQQAWAGSYASSGITWEPPNAGAWIINYGGSGAQKTLITDLVTQKLYLGSCEFVSVQAMRWRQTAWGVRELGSLVCFADIGDAGGGAYDEPTITAVQLFSAAAAINPASAILRVPQHARWWTPVVVNGALNQYVWGGTNPAIQVGDGGQSAVVDTANYRWMPPLARFELMPQGAYSGLTFSTGGVVLVNALYVGARFYLAC